MTVQELVCTQLAQGILDSTALHHVDLLMAVVSKILGLKYNCHLSTFLKNHPHHHNFN